MHPLWFSCLHQVGMGFDRTAEDKPGPPVPFLDRARVPGMRQTLQANVPFLSKWQLLTCPSNFARARMTFMRLSGGTKNIMNPPPPAPDTLPARAPLWTAAS